jgi:hypothetical protein
MATELFPMVGASDELMDPELHFSSGSRLCFGPSADPAVAANFSHVLLTNFSNSGVIAVVHKIILRRDLSTPIGVEIGQRGFPLATVDGGAAGHVRESRWGFAQRTSLHTQHLTQAASLTFNGSFQMNVLGNSQTTLEEKWVLGPGSQLVCRPSVQNVAVIATFFWRERKIEAGELRNTR